MRAKRNSGFTLAEVMVTIAIIGIGLTMVVQGLSVAKFKSLQTYNVKAARDLGLLTLGRVRSGLYQEELDTQLSGNYAEEGFQHFYFELLLGDETFDNTQPDEENPFHDSYAARQERIEDERRYSDDDSDDEEELEEDFEKVRIKVSFPPVGEYTSHVILEEWIPWDQVYGLSEEEQEAAEAAELEEDQ